MPNSYAKHVESVETIKAFISPHGRRLNTSTISFVLTMST